MKKIKDIILEKSLELFNTYGVSEISIRQIASEIGISHSNLIYHFKTKHDIIEALHNQLLENAIALNNKTKLADIGFIKNLYESTKTGFEILYEYRFLMINLNQIMRENEKLKQTFLGVEKIRAQMYREVIQKAIDENYMRKEAYQDEYSNFIEHIKIFSDSWISSAEIYDNTDDKNKVIKKYAVLFVKLFFPYLTEKGQKEFDGLAF